MPTAKSTEATVIVLHPLRAYTGAAALLSSGIPLEAV
jgi:hypothetical protein